MENIKTIQGWHESGVNSWTEYCKPGDLVDGTVFDYFLDILPPASLGHGYLQVGEPYSEAFDPDTGRYRSTYATFAGCGDGTYRYLGNCFLNGFHDPYVLSGVTDIQDFLKKTEVRIFRRVKRPRILCRDGFSMSVQTGDRCYSAVSPDGYSKVEVGSLSKEEEQLKGFVECEDDSLDVRVFPYVPVAVVDDVIKKHGGFRPLGLPYFC